MWMRVAARLLAALVVLEIAAVPVLAQAGPYPETGTEAWRELFAVDPADDPLGVPPFSVGRGTTYSTVLKGELAGFDIGHVILDVTVTDTGYSVDYKMEQKGIAKWFSDGEATSKASGLFGPDGRITSHYYFNHDYNNEDDQQRVELFRDAGQSRLRLWTLPEYTFREPVSEELAQGAIDPLAALVALAFQPVGRGEEPCERKVAVIDGRRRFDLVMHPDGYEYVRRNGPKRFEGDAWKCRLTQNKVAGYKENNRGDIDGEVWVYMIEVPKELQTDRLKYVPVRIVARSGIIGASLQAKRPTLIAADGTRVRLY